MSERFDTNKNMETAGHIDPLLIIVSHLCILDSLSR